jgi:hypothetical protein
MGLHGVVVSLAMRKCRSVQFRYAPPLIFVSSKYRTTPPAGCYKRCEAFYEYQFEWVVSLVSRTRLLRTDAVMNLIERRRASNSISEV